MWKARIIVRKEFDLRSLLQPILQIRAMLVTRLFLSGSLTTIPIISQTRNAGERRKIE